MPIEAWTDHRLTLKQLRVLGAIMSFADKDGCCHPKREAIAERCAMLPRHVSTATTELVALGWLKKVGGGGYSTPVSYAITVPESGTEEQSPNQGRKTEKNSPRIRDETVPESGTKTVPESGTKTVPESGTRKEQTIELTIELTKNRPVAAPPADATAPAPRKTKLSDELKSVCRETWDRYASAYSERYGVDPVKNAKVAGQVVAFVKRIPQADAPHVAQHYVASNARFYVERGHAFGNLLADAEKLRTEWATGRSITAATARQIDATQSNFNAAQQAKSLLAARSKS